MTRPTDRPGLHRVVRLALCAAIATLATPYAGHAETQFANPAIGPAPTGNSLFGSYLAGRFASSERDRSSAATFYGDALEFDPENRMLLERAMVNFVSAGNIAAAIELAPRVLKAAPTNRDANILLGLGALRDADYDQALKYFATTETGPIVRMATSLLEMWAHQAAGDADKAREIAEDTGDGANFETFRLYHSGLLAELQGRLDDAEAAYRASYESGKAPRTIDVYGRLLERRGKREEAIAIYRAALESPPANPILVASLARAEAAGPAPRIVSSPLEGAAETLYSVGSALTQDSGDLALIYLNLALYIRPNLDIARFLIADILDRQGRHEEAIDAFTGIGPTSPLKRESEIQAALSLSSLDLIDEARARLDALIEADPTDREALVSAGTMLRARERFDEAVSYYDRAIGLISEPVEEDWRLYYFRGICFERTKQWPKAEADLKQALELFPEQPHVLNYLGYSWIDLGMNLEEALGMVEKAVDQQPDDGYIVDSLGWAYYRLGDFTRAVEELERAVELRPDDPVINDHLGDAYWRVGRNLEARFQWDHALTLDPEEDEIAKIKAKLKDGMLEFEPTSAAAAEATGTEEPAEPAPAQ